MKKVIARTVIGLVIVVLSAAAFGVFVFMPIFFIVTEGQWGPAFAFGGVAIVVGFIAAAFWANDVLEGKR